MESFRVQYALGYQGSPLHVLDNDSALATCGNSICSYSFKNGLSKPILSGPRFGISTSAFNHSNKRIAYAEKGLHPSVYIYDSVNQQSHGKISDIAEVEVSAIAFSNDGSRIVTASSEPDFRLCLWDMQNEGPTKIAEGRLEFVVEFASFNPANSDQICTTGSGCMSVWTYEQNFQRTTFACKVFVSRPYEPHCHVWSEDGQRIYVGGLKGEVLSFDLTFRPEIGTADEEEPEKSFIQELIEGDLRSLVSEDAVSFLGTKCYEGWQLLRLPRSMHKASSICLGYMHLVVVESEGLICWLSLRSTKNSERSCATVSDSNNVDLESHTEDSADVADDMDTNVSDGRAGNSADSETSVTGNATSAVVYSMNLNVTQVTNMAYTADQTKLLIGAACGCITIIRISKQDLLSVLSGQSDNVSTENIAVVDWQSAYHHGPVLGFAILADGKFVLTSGQDGTVRVWEADRGKELSRHCFKSAQLCIDSHEETSTAVTGSENGTLCMFKVDTMGRSAIVFQNKIHIFSIDKVAFDKSPSRLVAAASKDDGKLYFLKCGFSDLDELELLGYTTVGDSLTSIAWDIPAEDVDQAYLLVSLSRGEIMKIRAPSSRSTNDDLFFDNKSLNCISFRTQVPLLNFVLGKYYLEKEMVERKVIWGMGQDKRLQQYRIPENAQGWSGSNGNALHAHFNLPGHAKIGTALVLHLDTSTLITGAEDGALQIRDAVLDPLRQPQKVVDVQLYDGHVGGITSLVVGEGRLFIGGANGAIYCTEVPAIGLKVPSHANGTVGKMRISIAPERTKHDSVADGDIPGQLSMLEKYQRIGDPRSALTTQSYRTEMKNKIQNIKQEFHDIVDINEKAPDLEKLLPSELIVDKDLECDLRSNGEKRVISIREQIIKENFKKDIMAERIKQECWKDVAEVGKYLWPFMQGFEVPNFPLHHSDSASFRAANVAKFIRIMEIQVNEYTKELKLVVSSQMDITIAPGTSQSVTSETIADGDVSGRSKDGTEMVKDQTVDQTVQLTNLETAAGKTDDAFPSRRSSIITARDSIGDKSGTEFENINKVPNDSLSPLPTPDEEQEENESPSAELLDKGPISNLLYDSFELTTPKRKRTQRFLLFKELHLIYEVFNKKFVALEENKEAIIEKITEMYSRILELQRKLGVKNDYILPQLQRHDDFESIFVVKDNEILVPNYAAIKKSKEDEINDLKRLKHGNNDAERALQDMMGGKLEHKKEEVIADAELEKPAWMFGNPKSFTKEQIKEIKEFDARLKAIKEEREKKQRAQEFEMRKLKNDIQDLMNNFDESLLQFFDHRLLEDAKCLEIEETITRLSMEIEDEEFLDQEREAELSKKLDLLKTVKGRSVGTVTEFKREVDEFKTKYEAAVGEDKTLDRNFKKDFSDCTELIPILYRHFKKRKPLVTKIITKAPKSPRLSISQERRKSLQPRSKSPPRASIQGRPSINFVKAPIQVDPFNDRPEEIDIDIWSRLLSARNRKILKEEEVRNMGEIFAKMTEYLNRLVSQDDLNRKKIERALRNLAEFRERRERKRRNLALLLHIKQGNVEIELNPLGGDYVDASLLPRSLIEEFNDVILREGNIKVKILTGMKDFKRGIYEIQWDIQRLQALERILIEKIRYIQLLRNTKALQMLIKNGEEMEKVTEQSSLESRLEHTRTLHDKRIKEKKMHLEQLQSKVMLLQSRNLKSQEKAADLYQQYIFQINLCEKSLGKESYDLVLKARERMILAKQKMIDKAKEQTNEIVKLVDDCQSLKKRSFPILPK